MKNPGIFFRCDKKDWEIWLEFKQFVVKKYGKLYSELGKETIEAIKFYMDNQKKSVDTYTNSQLSQLKQAINKNFGTNSKISKGALSNLIRRTLGVTHRQTINDKIQSLIAEHVIIPTDEKNYFKVLGGEILDTR